MKKGQRITQLTFEERGLIDAELKKGTSLRTLCGLLKRSKSTLSCEIRKNGGYEDYDLIKAQSRSDISRRFKKCNTHKITDSELAKLVRENAGKSPSVKKLCASLKVGVQRLFRVCHEHGIDLGGLHQLQGYGVSVSQRLDAIEMQIQILTDQIKEMHVRDNENKKIRDF